MTERHLELFNDSLERCTARPDFIERFYEIFIGSSSAVAEKFKNTNFNKQRRMLKASLYTLVFAAEGKPEGQLHLERISKLHNEIDVRPEMYDLWLDCLMQAVREFDPYFRPEVEAAWRSILSQGIDFMKARVPVS